MEKKSYNLFSSSAETNNNNNDDINNDSKISLCSMIYDHYDFREDKRKKKFLDVELLGNKSGSNLENTHNNSNGQWSVMKNSAIEIKSIIKGDDKKKINSN